MEIRDGLSHIKTALLPSFAAIGGMAFPALIFIALGQHADAWAIVMPTDVVLALAALALAGKKINPSIRLFLMTLAVADDALSLAVIAIFYRSDLDVSSAFYTIGAAAIGGLIPGRAHLEKFLAPTVTYLVIPVYIAVNIFGALEIQSLITGTSMAVVFSRVLGKVVGITSFTFIGARVFNLQLPSAMNYREVFGVSLLCGMGMTVSLVIAEITISDAGTLSQIRSGLFIAALISGLLGALWLRRSPAF